MLTRGAPQKRQSEGKRVAKRLLATPLTDETSNDPSQWSRAEILGPGSPDWVLTTAEDEPPAFARVWHDSSTG